MKVIMIMLVIGTVASVELVSEKVRPSSYYVTYGNDMYTPVKPVVDSVVRTVPVVDKKLSVHHPYSYYRYSTYPKVKSDLYYYSPVDSYRYSSYYHPYSYGSPYYYYV